MFNDLFNGVAGLAFVVLAVLVFWKYSQSVCMPLTNSVNIEIVCRNHGPFVSRGS